MPDVLTKSTLQDKLEKLTASDPVQFVHLLLYLVGLAVLIYQVVLLSMEAAKAEDEAARSVLLSSIGNLFGAILVLNAARALSLK